MDRLTVKGDFCKLTMCKMYWEEPCQYGNNCSLRKVWERLKEYEDTGLEPDAVQERMCGEIGGGKVHSTFVAFNGVPVDRLFELTEAEKDGRLVVLPCKVGDIVYQASADRIYESKIKAIIFDTNNIAFDERAIGKSIFLTREEAEAALKGCDGE